MPGSMKCEDCQGGWLNDGTKGCKVFKPSKGTQLKTAVDVDDCLGGYCSKYGSIGEWDVSDVTDMNSLFSDKKLFNGDFISNWDVSRVTNMGSMFYNAHSFNGDIGKWNVSSVTNMGSMFRNANSFNRDISKWDVSRVTNMFSMFADDRDDPANTFNRDISKWDVSSVTNMGWMFHRAKSFNGDISKWNVSSVTSMTSMFSGAKSFSRTLCGAWSKAIRNAIEKDNADISDVLRGTSSKICQ